VSTNLLGVAVSGPTSIPFVIVNVVGALGWGYGIRRWRMGVTLPRFFALNCLVALACTAFAVPIIIALGGGTGNEADRVTQAMYSAVEISWLAILLANIITSQADKAISGFVALLAVDVLPRRVTGSMRQLMPYAPPAPARAPLRSRP
jgi:energy-coupling factor transport system substrate-specific component